MKKISIIITALGLLVASLFTMNAQAQISAGVKAGVNVTKLKTGEDDSETKSKAGLAIGAFADYQLTSKLLVRAEAMYAQQGAKVGGGSYAINYVTIPVTVRYNVWNNLHVVTGPQIGLLTSAKIKYDGEKIDFKDNVKGTEFSWILGVGYELPKGFTADLRFIRGLSDISDNNADIIHSGFQFTVGYRLARRK